MHHRLTHADVLTVRTLLARGWRHIEIARELKLSVWTIARIHTDLRHELAAPTDDDELPVDDAPPDYRADNLRRCGGCGAMIYVWPCIACRMAVAQRVPPAPEVDDEADEAPSRPTAKQRRWRRRQVRELALGEWD
jgi:hypothetical protein